MPKVTNEDNIKKKLNYINLDLDNIPEYFLNSQEINYKPLKAYEENEYRVYKYVPISKIQILLSPTNRLNTIKEKYSKSTDIKHYLQPENEEDMLRHTTFLKMLKEVKIEDIEKISEEQEKLNKTIPFKVRFKENYLWQIYYSDIDDIYFMIVPTEDLEYASFFYLLKMQIEYHKTKKDKMIFVPISYQNYSNNFLKSSEIADLEKYLWFFTKNWSNVYNVYDKKGNETLQIIGETFVYTDIVSEYKIVLKDKLEALKFYKLVKALFILATELSHYYKFIPKIDRYSSLEFRYKDKAITYDNMLTMLKESYITAIDDIIELEKQKQKIEKKVIDLKNIVSKKEKEYLLKEKQIATYLECRKTFLGRVRYFLKSKKNKKNDDTDKELTNEENTKERSNEENQKMDFSKKEFYTIDDITKIYKELDKKLSYVNNLKMDEKALKTKVNNMEIKIKNANLYIKEINQHKKSIFEFWKFANKDENLMLNEGIQDEKPISKKIEKVYNYNEDKEEIGVTIDNLQRNTFSKEDLDAIYIATTDILNTLNNIDDDSIVNEGLKKLKQELEDKRILFDTDKIDMFGEMTLDNTKIKMLGNKKHRETKKEKLKILDINKNVDIQEYKEKIKYILNKIKTNIKMNKTLIGIPAYIALNEKQELKGLKVLNLNPQNAIEEFDNLKEIVLYRINLKEDTKVVYFSNSIYYDNYNKTLPLGMNVTEKVLIDCDSYKLKQVYKDDFRITNSQDEFKIDTKKIHLYEYELEIIQGG